MIGGRAVGAATVAASLLAATAAAGQPPRARTPDLTGLWTTASLTELERPDDFKALTATDAEAKAFEAKHRGKPPDVPPAEDPVGGVQSEWWETDVGLARIRGQVRTSWIVAPADGKRPFSAQAKAFRKARREARKLPPDNPESRDPTERCAGTGAGAPLENGGINDNVQIVQAGDQLAIHAEWMHDVRIVRIATSPASPEARHPPPQVRVVGGDSVGHWEGDTLVVETTNYHPDDVDAPYAPDADMKVVERFQRLSPTEIYYAYAVTSPARFAQTWRAEMVLTAAKGPIYEYACHEGNYALVDMLTGARHAEGKSVETAAAR